MTRLFLIPFLLAVFSPNLVRAEDPLAQFNLWYVAVKEEFVYYRKSENDLLSLFGKGGDFLLDKRKYDTLMPDFSKNIDISIRKFDLREAALQCRSAIIHFRWTGDAALKASNVNDTNFRREAREYVTEARECEKLLRLKPFSSNLRALVGPTD